MAGVGADHCVEVSLARDEPHHLQVLRFHHVDLQVDHEVFHEEEHPLVERLEGAEPDIVLRGKPAVGRVAHERRPELLELHLGSFGRPEEFEESPVAGHGVPRQHERQRPRHPVPHLELVPRRRGLEPPGHLDPGGGMGGAGLEGGLFGGIWVLVGSDGEGPVVGRDRAGKPPIDIQIDARAREAGLDAHPPAVTARHIQHLVDGQFGSDGGRGALVGVVQIHA
mmetsp:Transcript_65289/g.147276  ORF Transcript_65289/g.147276 Transcript_65289/m.147276 type:complete len:224 (+) Transcript_65289:771-1442(+)